MSSQSIDLNNGQQASISTNLSKIFLWNRRSFKGILNNSYYGSLLFRAGTVMARVGATGLLVPFVSTGLDGRQYPVGILMSDYTVAGGANQNIYVVDDGDVDETQLIFYNGFDSLSTNVGGIIVRDRLKQAGIKCIPTTELTKLDGQ